MNGDVRVFGRIDYVEVWNEERFALKLRRDTEIYTETLQQFVQMKREELTKPRGRS